ncbi:MAG: virulence RhuM family protein [Chitinophagales bacterium]|nr:virulence RhuM family protein [Chitinophagales bacterium]
MGNTNSEFILFKTEDEKISVDVRLDEQDVWLTQDQLALLFGVERPGITQHIKNIFSEGELQENSVSKKFLRTAADGKKYDTKHYNLDMIISLGYRVNSKDVVKSSEIEGELLNYDFHSQTFGNKHGRSCAKQPPHRRSGGNDA